LKLSAPAAENAPSPEYSRITVAKNPAAVVPVLKCEVTTRDCVDFSDAQYSIQFAVPAESGTVVK
jgi:hypothetical protein